MGALKQQFITDNQGKNIAVLLPIKEYEKLMDELDELECVKAYDRAKEGEQEFIPAEQAFKEIEDNRKKKNV